MRKGPGSDYDKWNVYVICNHANYFYKNTHIPKDKNGERNLDYYYAKQLSICHHNQC